MMRFNPRNVIDMLSEDFACISPSPRNGEEIRLRNFIKDILESHEGSEIFMDVDLDIIENPIPGPSTGGHEAEEGPSTSTSFAYKRKEDTSELDTDGSTDLNTDTDGITLQYKELAVAFWRGGINNKRKARTFKTVQHRFKKLKSRAQLYRWEKAVKGGGNKFDRSDRIREIVYEKFCEAKAALKVIHDLDLQKWAIQVANDIGWADFKASHHWMLSFKAHFNIVSRKITKVVTKAQITSEGSIRKAADDFIETVKNKMAVVGNPNTYNSDQSGFNLELRTGRSLHPCGSKAVNAVVQSMNATTHSYTVQPVVNAAGEFLKPMLLVLPETSGHFGPRVSKTMFQAPNLKVVATRSGKCTSDVLKKWYRKDFAPQISVNSVLILNAYGGFNAATAEDDDSCDDEDTAKEANLIQIERLPKHTTGLAQPLDVYGFRPYKNFVRKISDNIILNDCDFTLRVRDNIIKLQSLAFNQMCSPRYNNMFKFGWYKAGYLDTHPPVFVTPVEYSFPFDMGDCEKDDCGTASFIRCGWCSVRLCFNDFIEQFHYCEDFQE